MIGTLVTFNYETGFNESKVRTIADKARAKFDGMPGLRSKVFTVDPNAQQAVNFYVWESEEAAKAFFSPATLEGVTGLYGVRPTIQFVEIAAFVDNAHAKERAVS